MIKDIGTHLIYPDGRIFSKKRNMFFTPCTNGRGYLKITSGRKNYYLHRLIAEAFIPNPNGFTEINHIDGVKKNNSVNNLEWCSRSHNVKHSYAMGLMGIGENHQTAKLTDRQLASIREEYKNGASQGKLGRKYNVSQSAIYMYVHNKSRPSL